MAILPENTPTDYISDDYTINTWEITRLSPQYIRRIAQVPFVMATRGPDTIRGREAADPFKPSIGKKNKGPVTS